MDENCDGGTREVSYSADAGTLIITDTLRVEHGRKGKQRLVSAATPLTTRRRNATSRQEQAEMREALRYHVLKGIVEGE